MIYIISILKDANGNPLYYRGFDIHSESSLLLGSDRLKEIINAKIEVANASIINNEIVIGKWLTEIYSQRPYIAPGKFETKCNGAKYVLVTKEHTKYKLVEHLGNTDTLSEKKLKDLARSIEIANCRLIGNDLAGEIETMGVYDIKHDTKFEELIHFKYRSFIAKTAMLGYNDMTFNYIIENHEVKLRQYTGSSKDIILPSFITVVMKNAFKDMNIKTLNLNEGLKLIGEKAFNNGDIEKIEIPSTVKLICIGAFGFNKRLFDYSRLNTNRFKLKSNNTVVLDQTL